MNCIDCSEKSCRKNLESCNKESFGKSELINIYNLKENATIVHAASNLVDNNRAGKLSRIAEIIEFIKLMNYKNIGLAYCYGMEKIANDVIVLFDEQKISISAISCSIGGIGQDEINNKSCIHKVSCNPIGQAMQLNSQNVDFVIIMGICLGHDILLQRNLKCDFTTLIVKDRLNSHQPLLGIQKNKYSME